MINYLSKNNIGFIIMMLIIFSLLTFPNSIKSNFAIDIANISLFPISLLSIPILVLIHPRLDVSKISILIFLFCFLAFILNFVSENYIFQRYILSMQFFIPYFFLSSIKLNESKISLLKMFVLIAYIFLCFQVILSSLGIIKFNSVENNDSMGIYERVGTTAGVATFTGPILILLYSICALIFRSKYFSICLYVLLWVSVFLTGTRSSLIILVLCSFIYFIDKLKLKYKIIITISIIFLFPIINEKFKVLETIEMRNQRAMDYSGGDISSGREERWQEVFDIIKQEPFILITGVGGANTPYFNRYLKTELTNIASPHNVFLSILLEHGIFCFIIFLLILFNLVSEVVFIRSISSYLFIGVILFTFNTEVIPRSALFASVFFMLFYLLVFFKKKNYVKGNILQ